MNILFPWLPGKVVSVCEEDGTFEILFDHLCQASSPPFINSSTRVEHSNVRLVEGLDGIGGSGVYTNRELSGLHMSDILIPDIDHQHIISSEVVEEYHETEATSCHGGREVVKNRTNYQKRLSCQLAHAFHQQLNGPDLTITM